MVANRKPQNVPPPPNSRSASSQAVSRATGAKRQNNAASAIKKQQQKPSSTPPQPQSQADPPSSKKKQKQQKQKAQSRQSSSLLSTLFTIAFVLLSFHAFTTCPTDRTLSSPVCRALSVYRHKIVDPYIVPPISAALHSPTLEPYVHTIHQYIPHIQHAERKIRPYTQLAGDYLNKASSYVYYSLLAPNYRVYIQPQYAVHIHPHLTKLSPYVSKLITISRETWDTTLPHIENVHAHLKPHVQKTWELTRPYLYIAAHQAQIYLTLSARQLGELRKEFVDPHVHRIWEKVTESSIHASSPSSTANTIFMPKATVIETVVVKEESIPVVTVASSQVSEPRLTPDYRAPDAFVSETRDPVSKFDTRIQTEEAKTSAASIAEASAGTVQSGSIETLIEELVGDPTNVIPGFEKTVIVGEDTSDVIEEGEGLEIEDFLLELGLDEDEANTFVETETAVEQPRVTETPEEKAARVAAQRAELVGRHEKWQSQIDLAIEEGIPNFRKNLNKIRWEAVSDLEIREGGLLLLPDDEETTKQREAAGLAPLEAPGEGGFVYGKKGLSDEAKRLVKGLEGYLRKVSRKIGWVVKDGKETAEEIAGLKAEENNIWNDVVDKLEKRWDAKVEQIRDEVHSWYVGIREKEVQEVRVLRNNHHI